MNSSSDSSSLQLAFESLADPIAVLDQAGVIQYTNQAWKDLAGKDFLPSGRIGADYLAVWSGKKKSLVKDEVKITDGIRAVIEGKDDLFTCKLADNLVGENSWFEVKVTPFQGEEYAAVVTYEDITEQKQVKAELRKKNNLLTSSLSSIRGGIMILNSDLTIRYLNSTMKEWTNESPPFRGKKCFQVYSGQDSPCAGCTSLKCFTSENPEAKITLAPSNIEAEWVEHYSYPLKDEETGEVTGVVEFIRDVTDWKKAKQKLKVSENRYRNLFEASPVGIMLEDKQGTIVEVNKALCEMTGYNKGELEGKSIFKVLVPPEEKEKAKQNIERILAGEDIELTGKATLKNGEVRYFKLKETKITLANRKEGILSLRTDITKRKQAETKLKKKNKELLSTQEQLKEKNEKLNRQLHKGKQIHQELLPDNLPEFNGVRMASIYQPAEKIGADFYQTIQRENKIIFYISDITGHSLDGAFLNIFLRETIKTFLTDNFEAGQELSLPQMIEFISYQFRLENFPDDYFISLLLFVLDQETMNVKYINAGLHIPPILIKAGKSYQLTAKGPPISNVLSLENCNFAAQEFNLNNNSTLVITTDGLVEEKWEGARYGTDRLEEVITCNYQLPPQLLLGRVIEDLEEYTGQKPIKDDLTLFGISNKKIVDELQLILPSEYKKLATVKEKMTKFLAPYCSQINELLIGLQEVLINAIEHGNQENYELSVEVKGQVREDSIILEVKDEGKGFNWRKELNKELNLANFRDRGRGLAVVKKAVDRLGYNQVGNKAILYSKRVIDS